MYFLFNLLSPDTADPDLNEIIHSNRVKVFAQSEKKQRDEK